MSLGAESTPVCGSLGRVDDVGAFGRVLTDNELVALYMACHGRTTAVGCARYALVNSAGGGCVGESAQRGKRRASGCPLELCTKGIAPEKTMAAWSSGPVAASSIIGVVISALTASTTR